MTDGDQERVQRFDANGTFLGEWGAEGVGAGRFLFPAAVAAAGGTVFVLDLAGSVQRFGPDGTVLGRWGSSWGGLGLGPNGIATDGAGSVYVVDDQERILKFVCP